MQGDLEAPVTDTPEHLRALRGAGWAPGNYIVACIDCDPSELEARRYGDWRMGDKRAIRCRPCAEKVVAAAPTVEQSSMVQTDRLSEALAYRSAASAFLASRGVLPEFDAWLAERGMPADAVGRLVEVAKRARKALALMDGDTMNRIDRAELRYALDALAAVAPGILDQEPSGR